MAVPDQPTSENEAAIALHFPLMINTTVIGYFYAQRIEGTTDPDSSGIYRIEITHNGRVWQSTVRHRYGDGAFVLVRKALAVYGRQHKAPKGQPKPAPLLGIMDEVKYGLD